MTNEAVIALPTILLTFRDLDGQTYTEPLYVRTDLGQRVSKRGNRYVLISWNQGRRPNENGYLSPIIGKSELTTLTHGGGELVAATIDGRRHEIDSGRKTWVNGKGTQKQQVQISHGGRLYLLSVVRHRSGSGAISGVVMARPWSIRDEADDLAA